MKLLEKNIPAAENTDCLGKLEILEKKIKLMIDKILELKTENETLKAELKYHEKNTGKLKYPAGELDDFLRQRKKARDLLENLIDKFSNAGI